MIRSYKILASTFFIFISFLGNSFGLVYVPGTKVFKKVIGCSDKLFATSNKDGGENIFKIGLLVPYFVVSDDGDYYIITDKQKGGSTGFIAKKNVIDWNTREGLHFRPTISMMGERTDVKVWKDISVISKFAKSGDEKRFRPSYIEERRVSRALPKKMLPYPVVDSDSIPTIMGSNKKIYKVYIPAYIPETKIEVKATPEKVKEVLKGITFCVVFDSTGSMGPYGKLMADTIETLIKSVNLPPDKLNMGFIFFKDIEDPKPVNVIIPKQMEKAFMDLREEAASGKMNGGGDGPEPILDAMVLAATDFNWEGTDSQHSGEKRVIIAVLNDDAKPQTVGLTESIGKGQNLDEVISLLDSNYITVFSLQAGKNDGGLLVKTLSAFANATGGEFYPFGSEEDHQSRRNFSSKIKNLMETVVRETENEAESIGSATIPTDRGYSVLPLRAVNSEVLNRLRAAAIKYNIQEGGFMVREGWMFEKEDLYQVQILVEKEMLEKLIRIFNYLGEVGTSGEILTKAVLENLQAILGEKLEKNSEIQEIIEKKLGIHFNTNLLAFDVDLLFAMTPKERLATGKRLKEAGGKIANFLEASTSEFNKNGQAWMEMSYLP